MLGAFNPGLTRLPSGDLLMTVRVAEALREPIRGGHVHATSMPGRLNARWDRAAEPNLCKIADGCHLSES